MQAEPCHQSNKNIHKRNMRLSPLSGAVNIFTCIFMGHPLPSDHKPLEWIFNNPKSKPPARIERWGLRIQPYNYTVRYKSGKDNPADYMSCHPARFTSFKRFPTPNNKWKNMWTLLQQTPFLRQWHLQKFRMLPQLTPLTPRIKLPASPLPFQPRTDPTHKRELMGIAVWHTGFCWWSWYCCTKIIP